MKKLLFSIFLTLALLFVFNHAHAQNVTQYEYASLMLPGAGSDESLFITTSGVEKIKAAEYTGGIAGGWTKASVSRFSAFIEIVNKKAKDGWEPIMPLAEGGLFVMLRRSLN